MSSLWLVVHYSISGWHKLIILCKCCVAKHLWFPSGSKQPKYMIPDEAKCSMLSFLGDLGGR